MGRHALQTASYAGFNSFGDLSRSIPIYMSVIGPSFGSYTMSLVFCVREVPKGSTKLSSIGNFQTKAS